MTTRTQQADKAELKIQPPRMRMHLDRLAMNRPIETLLAPIKEKIEQIRKQGAPVLPEKPEKEAEQEVKDVYKEAQKAYNKYSSADYEKLTTVHELVKKLQKIASIQKLQHELAQEGKELTKKQLAELAKEQKTVADQPADGQTAEEYESHGFAPYTAGVNVSSEAEVHALTTKLLGENPSVQLLTERDRISKDKTRFTDAAIIALATASEMGIREFIEHGMATTLTEGKRIMLPDHCVSKGLENCSLYSLFDKLPTFRLVADRQTRRAAWERDHAEWKAENKRNNRAKGNARRKNPKAAKATPPTPYQTFEEREVEQEFAIETETTAENGDVKTKVMWRGIDDFSKVDVDEDEDGDETARKFGFDFYINLLCKDVKEAMTDEDAPEGTVDYKDIRVSTDIKRFLSNLIKEFIHRVAPQIRLYMDYKEAKTVSYGMIETVLKSILMDSYVPDENGVVEFNDTHKNLFDEMARRRDLYAERQKNKKAGIVEEEAEADDGVDTEEEETPAPAPKKRTTRNTRAESTEEPAEPVVEKPAKTTKTTKAAKTEKAAKVETPAEPEVEKPKAAKTTKAPKAEKTEKVEKPASEKVPPPNKAKQPRKTTEKK